MAQQFDYLTETKLRETLDAIYGKVKSARKNGARPSFRGLIEIMGSEATIVTAIHKLKANKGSRTPGVDHKTMQKDYLDKPYKWVIQDIQNAFRHYVPEKIRREYIDKPGKIEKRPLGIPTIRDRIVQECMRMVLEPMLEAQFFEHSYGFRPMRDAQMALKRVTHMVHLTGYHWIVEGDISKCFDRIDHRVLLKRLYHMGVKDKRVLQIIKEMLKAGVIGESEVNEDGTQQGGVLSPLLANVYLDILDEWVSKQWEYKETRHIYSTQGKKMVAIKSTNLIPAYFVRYADDWVLMTDSRQHAELWKEKIEKFLSTNMRLTLSKEKTLITDLRKRYVKFLGYEYKLVPGKGRHGYITRTLPDRKRAKAKVDEIIRDIKGIPRHASREEVIHHINLINSKILGLINYYKTTTSVYLVMKKHSQRLFLAGRHRLKQYKGKSVMAKSTANLIHQHEGYSQKIPAIQYGDMYVGITSISFCKWENTLLKNMKETPFTDEGRRLYFKRTDKQRANARLDEILSTVESLMVSKGKNGRLCTFEYYMNRAYALNRDRWKCRVCGGNLIPGGAVFTHRINPQLPAKKVNKVANLASMDGQCFDLVNSDSSLDHLEPSARRKIQEYRERLHSHKG